MGNTTFDSAKLLLKDSPYLWKDKQILCCENTNCECTFEQIEKMKSKHLLSAVDFSILELLAKYKFLTLTHINFYLNRGSLLEAYKKDNYESNIRKMVRAGLIKKYCFVTEQNEFYRNRKYSVRFYDLSKGSYSYMRDILKIKTHHLDAIQNPERILELLSLNQFDLGLINTLNSRIVKRDYVQKRKIGPSLVEFDLYYSISHPEITLPLHFYVTSVRSYPEYLRVYLDKLRIIRTWIQMSNRYGQILVLVLCESIEQIKKLYHVQMNDDSLKNEPILYTTDISNYVFGGLNSLMECRPFDDMLLIEHLKFLNK